MSTRAPRTITPSLAMAPIRPSTSSSLALSGAVGRAAATRAPPKPVPFFAFFAFGFLGFVSTGSASSHAFGSSRPRSTSALLSIAACWSKYSRFLPQRTPDRFGATQPDGRAARRRAQVSSRHT